MSSRLNPATPGSRPVARKLGGSTTVLAGGFESECSLPPE
jgi:hypothetical protein